MTYEEALSLKSAIEAALLSASTSGVVSVSHGDRSITYDTKSKAVSALNEINRSIIEYNRRASGKNSFFRSPRWP